jgi:hypothetical protein
MRLYHVHAEKSKLPICLIVFHIVEWICYYMVGRTAVTLFENVPGHIYARA